MNRSPSRAARRFPKTARLLKHAEFDRVYRQGRRHFGGHLTVFYLPRPQSEAPRVGFTLSRALGSAVERNRIRRRVREALRLHLRELEKAVDVVINPKRSAAGAGFPELEAEISRALARINRDQECQDSRGKA